MKPIKCKCGKFYFDTCEKCPHCGAEKYAADSFMEDFRDGVPDFLKDIFGGKYGTKSNKNI